MLVGGGDIAPALDPDPGAEAGVPPPSSMSNSAHSHEILYFEWIGSHLFMTGGVGQDWCWRARENVGGGCERMQGTWHMLVGYREPLEFPKQARSMSFGDL